MSTTKDFNQAKMFSNNGIVLFSWEIKNLHVKYDDILVCEELPFEEEKENTKYRGIFPHYIYGFQVINDDMFVVNHQLFSKFNRNIEEVIKRGFLFNQYKFNEVLSGNQT